MKYTTFLPLKITFLAVLLFSMKANSQIAVKANLPFAAVGIINLAVEKPVAQNISLQAEGLISPWKSFYGKNLQVYMGTLEGRYYFDGIMKKWFVGAYGSVAAFDLQKWNYFSAQPVLDEYGNPQLLEDGSIRRTERYQRGMAFIFGVSGGYHFTISENLGLDVLVGIGATQSIYRGFLKDTNERYDGAEKWNKSGEILPTRAGLMLTYKIL